MVIAYKGQDSFIVSISGKIPCHHAPPCSALLFSVGTISTLPVRTYVCCSPKRIPRCDWILAIICSQHSGPGLWQFQSESLKARPPAPLLAEGDGIGIPRLANLGVPG